MKTGTKLAVLMASIVASIAFATVPQASATTPTNDNLTLETQVNAKGRNSTRIETSAKRKWRITCKGGHKLTFTFAPKKGEVRQACKLKPGSAYMRHGKPRIAVTCANKSIFIFNHRPNIAEMDSVCGFKDEPKPTTTTTIPRPKVVSVNATYGSKNQYVWLGSNGLATPETCPTYTTISYTAVIADGTTYSGTAEMHATEGISSYAEETLPGGQIITFSLYLMPGGGCIKGILM